MSGVIVSIGGLQIPDTLSGNVESFNADSRRRAISGKLISKLAPWEKWRATLNYEGRAVLREFRIALYTQARSMRSAAAPVTFVSPEDGATYVVDMLCIQRFPAKVASILDHTPEFFTGCGAVFEEV
jgi:hypothetical protein